MSLDTLYGMMKDAVKEREQMHERLYDLWSWLPSHEHAKSILGDYAFEAFDPESTIHEATQLLSLMAGFHMDEDEALDAFCVGEWFYEDRSIEMQSRADRLGFIRGYLEERHGIKVDELLEVSGEGEDS